MIEHHELDIEPVAEKVLFVNEPWVLDMTAEFMRREPEGEKENVRIYVPLDLNKHAILRRLEAVIARYGKADEFNESSFSEDVNALVYQIKVYNQIWSARRGELQVGPDGKACGQSREAVELVKAFIERLEDIPDGGAECFPFHLIAELRADYLGK